MARSRAEQAGRCWGSLMIPARGKAVLERAESFDRLARAPLLQLRPGEGY